MPDRIEPADAYDKARDQAEAALDAYAKKDEGKGDKLIQEAQSLDPDAVKDVMQDLEEDAQSEHDPKTIRRELDSKSE